MVDLTDPTSAALLAAEAAERSGLEYALFEGIVFGGLVVDRVTLVGGEDDLGLDTIDLVRPRSDRYAGVAQERAIEAPLRGRTVRVLAPEDFVVFKVLSTRERDLADAASVIRRVGEALDRSAIEAEIDHLAGELPDVEIRERWAGLP